MGHCPIEGGGGRLYGFDAAAGKVLWVKDVPEGPITAIAQVRRHAWAFDRGPDGHVWTFLGDVLVRIAPDTARIEPVGRLPRGSDPAQLVFLGGQVYIGGAANLRRIDGLTVEPSR
jgi:hypothetical protein